MISLRKMREQREAATLQYAREVLIADNMRRDDQVRRIAELLYDELTGKNSGVEHRMREFEDNAALADVWLPPRDMWKDRDEKVYVLLREADYLGYEVHRRTPDRWGLANRLAEKVMKRLENDED